MPSVICTDFIYFNLYNNNELLKLMMKYFFEIKMVDYKHKSFSFTMLSKI